MFITYDDIIIDVAPDITLGDLQTGLSLRLPKGLPATMLNSLRYKDLIQDMVLLERDPAKLEAKYGDQLTLRRFAELKAGLESVRANLLAQQGKALLDLSSPQNAFIQAYYANVLDRVENAGHRFGEGLSERDKRALIAFLATL